MISAAPSRRAKDVIRGSVARIYCSSGLSRRLHRGKAVILAYHRVLRAEDLEASYIQPGMYVLDEVFETHMRFLRDLFEIVPLAELLSRWRSGDWDRRARYCAITFDDGWRDNYLYAYPILRRYGIPATIFLPTTFIGTRARFWWDELADVVGCWLTRPEEDGLAQLSGRYPWLARLGEQAAEERLDWVVEQFKNVPEREIGEWLEASRLALGRKAPAQRVVVSWQEVEEMSASGISFGSHSCTHRILTRLSREELRQELRDSLDSLGRRPIRSVPVLSYPNGDYSRDVVEEAQRAGYEAAVSGRSGLERSVPDDLWALKRIGVHNDISSTPDLFALRVSGLRWA